MNDVRPTAGRLTIVWLLFVAICVGLGYPTLRRYDPRDPRTNFDGTTALYHWQVTGDPQEGSFGPSMVHFRYRLLVPSVARAFYLLGRGHVGTWDPGYFGFLLANAIFCGSTALLIVLIGIDVFPDRAWAVVAGFVYLASFAVPNYLLAGLVDSGEAFVLTAVVWSLQRNRWWVLPILAIAGALAKETFVPFGLTLVGGWLIAERATGQSRAEAGDSLSRLGWFATLGLASLATLTLVFSIGNGRLVLPWQFERSGTLPNLSSSVTQGVLRISGDIGLLYVFGWLGPLGVLGASRWPRPWAVGALATAVVAFGLGVFNGEPGLARSLFNILGPLLSIGTAATLLRLLY